MIQQFLNDSTIFLGDSTLFNVTIGSLEIEKSFR